MVKYDVTTLTALRIVINADGKIKDDDDDKRNERENRGRKD